MYPMFNGLRCCIKQGIFYKNWSQKYKFTALTIMSDYITDIDKEKLQTAKMLSNVKVTNKFAGQQLSIAPL